MLCPVGRSVALQPDGPVSGSFSAAAFVHSLYVETEKRFERWDMEWMK